MIIKIAKITNALVLAFLAYILFDEGFPSNGEGWVLLIAFFTAPLINLVALSAKMEPHKNKAGLLKLYIQRKGLEEKKRIAELEKELQQ
ncbi:MAG TPA: hypothetical protein VHP34_04745 [Alphaproteobacteria bacterium]|jgi:hypothetical protein|nr:hypothetical protein [Alphaproteobacteria bacterium]